MRELDVDGNGQVTPVEFIVQMAEVRRWRREREGSVPH